jgi:hypothetical protein
MRLALLLVFLLLPSAAAHAVPGWPQWGGGPDHSGQSAAAGQPLAALLSDLLYDPFVELEKAESSGDLTVHYAVPLADDSGLYNEIKSGFYVPCSPPGDGMPSPCGPDAWALQVWNVRKFVWRSGALTEAWNFASDWKPEPSSDA